MASLIREPNRPRKPWRVDWSHLGGRRTRRFATKREAEALIGEVARGKRGATSVLTLRDWVPRWISEYGPEWEPRTRRDRARDLDRWVLPYLGSVRLRDLTRSDIRAWRTEIVGDGATVHRAQRALVELSACLGDAVEDDLIPANPCSGIKPLSWKKKDREPATLAEVETIRLALPKQRDRAAVSLMAYAGLRPGELIALRSVDVRQVTIVVRRGGRTSGGTKTEGVRAVPIIDPIAEDLDGLEAGETLLGISNWNNWSGRVWRPTLATLGISAQPYALRHTAASLWIAEGRSVLEVAQRLGHSTPRLTLDTYGHLFGEAQLAEDEEMTEAIARARHEASRSSSLRTA